MSLGSPDFYRAIVGVANKKSLRTPALSQCHEIGLNLDFFSEERLFLSKLRKDVQKTNFKLVFGSQFHQLICEMRNGANT
jgi:hypothetical protein